MPMALGELRESKDSWVVRSSRARYAEGPMGAADQEWRSVERSWCVNEERGICNMFIKVELWREEPHWSLGYQYYRSMS